MTEPAPRTAASRAADTDRVQVAQLLTDAAAEGLLELDDYERRLAQAYSATTYAELDRLSADLPGIANTRRGACRPAPETTLLAFMSGFERRGRWNVPRKLTMFSFCGSGVIDLRYADFTSPDVEIKAYSIMGGQTILLPPEVNLTVEGTSVMGSFEEETGGAGTPGAPVVTVTGFSLWGGVNVRRKKRRPNRHVERD